MSLHTKTRTLGQLKTELSVRLGFVSVGQSAVMHEPLLVSFLQDAAEQIYAQYGDELLYKVSDEFDATEGTRFYDIPDSADPFSITDMVLEYSPGHFHPMIHGIPNKIRTKGDTEGGKRNPPTHWDIAAGEDETNPGKIELYPIPDREYTVKLSYYPMFGEAGWGVIDEEPYINLDAPCPIYPSRLVLLLALGNAKSHFGMQDAQASYKQFEQYLSKHKASMLSGIRFARRFKTDGWGTEYGTGMRKKIGDDIIVDLTPPESITTEYGDTILPETSREGG